MGSRTGRAVTKASLVINIMSISLLLLLSSPAAILIGIFVFSLMTDELFDLEGMGLFVLAPLLLLFALLLLLFCLIITVGCRVYLDSIGPLKGKRRGRLGPADIVWVVGLTILNFALLVFLGVGDHIDPGEAIALWFILMLGMALLALDYGLTTMHLTRFHDKEWAQFHRGLARLPPFLLLLGFPAVVVLELLESVPFISVLFIFCWGILIFSFITTVVTSVRMLVALTATQKGERDRKMALGTGARKGQAGPGPI